MAGAKPALQRGASPDGSFMLMGGHDGNYPLNDTWRSFDSGMNWVRGNEIVGWSARTSHSCAAMPDGSIILTGGYAHDGSITGLSKLKNDTWFLYPSGASWMRINASSGWIARSDHAMVVLPDNSIVLMGGYDDSSGGYSNDLSDVWLSDDSGTRWTLMTASAPWGPRSDMSAFAMPDGSIILAGGSHYPATYNDTWRSADKGRTWTQVNTSSGWTARDNQKGAGLVDGSILLAGGYDLDGEKNDTWRFQPAGSTVQNPLHTYIVPGTYNVSLQVSNS